MVYAIRRMIISVPEAFSQLLSFSEQPSKKFLLNMLLKLSLQLLYVLNSGQKLKLWASEKHCEMAKDLLKKLSLLRVYVRRTSAVWKEEFARYS